MAIVVSLFNDGTDCWIFYVDYGKKKWASDFVWSSILTDNTFHLLLLLICYRDLCFVVQRHCMKYRNFI